MYVSKIFVTIQLRKKIMFLVFESWMIGKFGKDDYNDRNHAELILQFKLLLPFNYRHFQCETNLRILLYFHLILKTQTFHKLSLKDQTEMIQIVIMPSHLLIWRNILTFFVNLSWDTSDDSDFSMQYYSLRLLKCGFKLQASSTASSIIILRDLFVRPMYGRPSSLTS